MNGIGYKVKKGILYFLLILLAAVCLFPFLLMMVNATRSGNEIVTSFTLFLVHISWRTGRRYLSSSISSRVCGTV